MVSRIMCLITDNIILILERLTRLFDKIHLSNHPAVNPLASKIVTINLGLFNIQINSGFSFCCISFHHVLTNYCIYFIYLHLIMQNNYLVNFLVLHCVPQLHWPTGTGQSSWCCQLCNIYIPPPAFNSFFFSYYLNKL